MSLWTDLVRLGIAVGLAIESDWLLTTRARPRNYVHMNTAVIRPATIIPNASAIGIMCCATYALRHLG